MCFELSYFNKRNISRRAATDVQPDPGRRFYVVVASPKSKKFSFNGNIQGAM